MSLEFSSPLGQSTNVERKLESNKLKNFGFLVPHIFEFENELQELLVEIDMLIEKKKCEWEGDLQALERKLSIKVSENNRLQGLVNEKERDLQDAFRRLEMVESKDQRVCYGKQIEELSHKVNAMKASYSNLQRKYQNQLAAEKSDFSMHLRNLETENEALKAEYERLRQKNEQIISSLKQQLADQKSDIIDIQKRYDELQSQFEVKLQEEANQKNNIKEMKEEHQSAIDKLSKQLNDHKNTIKLQAEELVITKASLTNKISEIHRLPHEAEMKKSVINGSQKSVKRLEKTVAKHLNLLSHRKHNSTLNISVKHGPTSFTDLSSPLQQQQQPLNDQEEITHKVKYLENQLSEANNTLIDKMLEISRLENTCQVASATIRRLVESKACSNGQTKSLETSIDEARERVRNFERRLSLVEEDLSSKLSKTISEIYRLKKYVYQIQASRSYEINRAPRNCTSDKGVQTSDYLLPNDELIKLTTTLALNDTQSENPTSSNLLTDKKELDKMPNNCCADLNSTLFINRSNNSIHRKTLNTPVDLVSKQIEMGVNHSQVQINQGNKNCSNFKQDFHSNISLLGNSTDICNGSKNSEQLVQIIPNKMFKNKDEIQMLPVSESDVVTSYKPIPSVRSKLLSPSDDNNDDINSNENELIDLDKNVYDTISEPTLLTLNSSASEISKFAKINEIIVNSFPNSSLNYPTDSIRIVSTSVPHFSVYTQDSTFVESDTNFQCYKSMNLSNEEQSSSFEKKVNHHLPSYCSTLISSPSSSISLYQSQINHNNLNEEDTDVYNLAAQFLVDEQKHSMLLEQQIDAHLKCLQEYAGHFNELY
uniref:Putative centrosomal protein of 63 kDa (Cep63 protein) n=2 Tax=Schistosoma mansoni TaxID=6183 RepID=A0A3Q0KQJ4_SCHMA